MKDSDFEQKMNEQAKETVSSDSTSEPTDPALPIVSNAGLILFGPLIPKLFSTLGYTDGNKFKSQELQIRAVYLLQQAVYSKTDIQGCSLLMNKLLVGLDAECSIDQPVELTSTEVAAVNTMLDELRGKIGRLEVNTALSFQRTFVQRTGTIEDANQRYILTIPEKIYDRMLMYIPWSILSVNYPWMSKQIWTRWKIV